jgi:hypothetical protein
MVRDHLHGGLLLVKWQQLHFLIELDMGTMTTMAPRHRVDDESKARGGGTTRDSALLR